MSSGPVTAIRRVKRERAPRPDLLYRINDQNQLVDALGNVIEQLPVEEEGVTSSCSVEEGGDWNPSDDDMSEDEDKPEAIESVSENEEDDDEVVEEEDDEEELVEEEEEEESDDDDEEDEDEDAMDVDD
jgi:hypothetical protein